MSCLHEGPEERVRLDMLAQLSIDRIVPAYDVIRRQGVPEQYHATNLGFWSSMTPSKLEVTTGFKSIYSAPANTATL